MAKVKKLTALQWLGIAAAVIVGSGAIAGATYASKDTKKLNAAAFKVAAVDELGRVYEAETSIVSKKFKTTKAELTFDKDAKVGVFAHYYDEDGNYISSSDLLTEDVELTAPEGAAQIAFEIVPEDDDEIDFLEKIKYCGQVKIVYEKN